MKILALDSATSVCSAAAWADGVVLAHEHLATRRGQAELLLPLVERVRAASGLGYPAFDRLAVTIGPGHFTGLRAGLAAARGLALAAGVPLVGVTTLQAIAAAVPASERAGAVVVVALNSKRAQPFVQAFGSALDPLGGPAALDLATLPAEWPERRGHEARFIAAGDEAEALANVLAARGAVVAHASSPPLPDARFVAELAAHMPAPAAPPAPLYIHPVETTAPRPRPSVAGGMP